MRRVAAIVMVFEVVVLVARSVEETAFRSVIETALATVVQMEVLVVVAAPVVVLVVVVLGLVHVMVGITQVRTPECFSALTRTSL